MSLSKIEYAKKLLPLTEFDRLFYANSGAEANEGAIKLALKYTGKSEIITAKDSFHGRTLLTLAATGHEEYREPYLKNLPQGFIEVPFLAKFSNSFSNVLTILLTVNPFNIFSLQLSFIFESFNTSSNAFAYLSISSDE